MRVCLINPPWSMRRGNIWKHIRATMSPLGLLYLAAVLEEAGFDVDVIDFQSVPEGWDEIATRLRRRPYDFYGISATTAIIKNGYRIADIIKSCWPQAMIVFGGVHPTALPEEAMARESIDFVVRGEGEYAMLELVRGTAPEGIEGITYRGDEGVCHVGDDCIVSDLDGLPPPAFHKVDLSRYRPAVGAYLRTPAMNMMSSRGCPGRCTFCNSANVRLRKRSAQKIFDEMQMLSRDYGIREISFYDDTFTALPQKVMQLCELLIEAKLDMTWSCFGRVDTVKAKMLQMMKAAGCHQVMYGIESGNAEILRRIRKPIDPGLAVRAVEMTKAARIITRCTFMLGNPGETEETIEETIRFAIALEPDIALFNVTTPYPGTEMFLWAKEKGYIRTFDWDEYNLGEPVMVLPTIATEVLKRMYGDSFRRFYLRPRFFSNTIRHRKLREDLPILCQGAKSLCRFAWDRIWQ